MSSTPEVQFTFEGKTISAREGQSIAGALHATGTRTLARGVKYHRPRGYACGFGACGSCPLNIDGMPSTTSCTAPVTGGEVVRRETGIPSARIDLLRAADLMRPFLKAGFQFTLFPRSPRLSKWAGSLLGILAGGGRMPSRDAVERATVARVVPHATDVVVVGGGLSGLTAALAAAHAGARVMLVDHELAGGRSRVRTEPVRIDGADALAAEQVDALLTRVREHGSIRAIRGTAIGVLDGLVPVLESETRTRHEIAPAAIVLATGSYETPILCDGHDLPGVMLADGALRLALMEGVRPGRRAIVIDGDPRASDVAHALRRSGVEVRAIVPASRVQRVTGWARATGVRLRSDALHSRGRARSQWLRADLICMVGPRRAAEELTLHAAYAQSGSHELVANDAAGRCTGDGVVVVGSAGGSAHYSVDDVATAATRLAEFAVLQRAPAADPVPPTAVMNMLGKVVSTTALVAAGALALSSCAGGGGGSGDSGSSSLTVVSYGGPYQEAQSEAFFTPFSEESGIEVVEDSPTDYAQLRSMVETGRPTWDLVLVANDFGTTADADYLEPIDYDVIDQDVLIEGAAQEYRVAADIEATVLAYRSDEYDDAPSSWEDLFDTEKYPGKRMFNKLVSGGVLEAALLADGVAPDELFPLDVDRALAKLDTIKDDIVWWETSAQSQQLLASGEASMGLAWVGRAVDAGKEAPVGISWDSWLQVDAYWVIPQGAPNADNAQDALAFLLQEDPQLAFAELSDYGPVNAAAAEDAAVQENENRPTNHLDTQVGVDDEWWGEHQEDTDREFQEWLLS